MPETPESSDDVGPLLHSAAAAGASSARPAGAADVRAIGGRLRRTRTIMVGGVSALAVAGVVGVVVTASATGTGTLPPADTPMVTATTATEGALADHMLTRDDVVATYSPGGELPWVEGAGPDLGSCAVPAGDPAADDAATVTFAWTTSGTGERVDLIQDAELYADANDAAQRFAAVLEAYATCAVGIGGAPSTTYDVGGLGDQGAYAVAMFPSTDAPDVPGDLIVVARIARTGSAVTWTTFAFPGQDYNFTPEPESIIPAVEHLCGWVGGACVSEDLDVSLTYPAPGDQVDGLLTLEDVQAAYGSDGWVVAPSPAVDPAAPNVVCSPQTLVDAGGTDLAVQAFYDETDVQDPPTAGLTTTRATFPDAASAAGYVDAQSAGFTDCPGAAEPPAPIDGVANAWAFDFGDFTSVYGFVAEGDAVVLVEITMRELDAQVVSDLMASAADRAA